MAERVVANFSSENEAEMALEYLKARGIQAILLKDDAGNMLPSLQQTEGVHLIVDEAEEEKAKRYLDEKNPLQNPNPHR